MYKRQQVRKRLEEKDTEQQERRAEDDKQRYRVANAPLRLVLAALAELEGEVGRRAVADEQRKGDYNHGCLLYTSTDLEVVDTCPEEETGTEIRFWPDPEIFEDVNFV